jgi:hypothetical protein
VYPSVRPSVGGFFICDRISDGKGNYRRLVYRRTTAVGETVGNNFTDGVHALHLKLFNGVVVGDGGRLLTLFTTNRPNKLSSHFSSFILLKYKAFCIETSGGDTSPL